MNTEIEVERTARILKQADPGRVPSGSQRPSSEPSASLIVAIVAAVVAFVGILVTIGMS